MISLEKWLILRPLQKLPKNGEDLGNLIAAQGFKKLSNKSPNLVTLFTYQLCFRKLVTNSYSKLALS